MTEQQSGSKADPNPLSGQAACVIARNPAWALGETQNAATGYVGLVTTLLCAAGLVALSESKVLEHSLIWDLRLIIALALVFVSMVVVEIGFFKTHRRNFDFSKARPLDGAASARVGIRTLAFYLCLVVAGCFFSLMSPVFKEINFMPLFYLALPFLLLLSPAYFIMVEKHGREDGPPDEVLILGEALLSPLRKRETPSETSASSETAPSTVAEESAHKASVREHLLNLIRGIMVKGFFIPFMVVSGITIWNLFVTDASLALHANFNAPVGSPEFGSAMHKLFQVLMDVVLVADINIAVLGYLTSCRILDTQFTTAEPTFTGWLVTLVCYPPANVIWESYVVRYAILTWPDEMFVRFPVVSIVVSIVILILMAVYSWATVVFGLRFSNLTNRGIICSGPYRLVRHPAYAGKNLSWWFALLPTIFLSGLAAAAGPALLLVFLNITYVLRGLTEERHLKRENHYLDYMKRVRWKFIPGMW